jgi:hypothetical protein
MVDKIRQSLSCIIMRDRPIEALEESWVGGEVRLYFSHNRLCQRIRGKGTGCRDSAGSIFSE